MRPIALTVTRNLLKEGTIVIRIFNIIKSKTGDLQESISDLILFLTYISVSFYAGGYTYLSEYNEFFALPVKVDPGNLLTLTIFLENVFFSRGSLISFVFLICIFFVISFNFVGRHVFTLWFAYISISIISILVILGCIFLGSYFGKEDAKHDISSQHGLPQIKRISISENKDCQQNLDMNKDIRLLLLNEKYMYFFQRVDPDNSEVIIKSITLSCISSFELRRTGQ